jgi:predicted HTH transcriptional regulator
MKTYAAMLLAVDRAIAFIERNTWHPMKVVGLNRVRLDEYPVEALREGAGRGAKNMPKGADSA